MRENEVKEALSPEFQSTLHETKFLSYLILSREQPVEPGFLEQLAVNSRGEHLLMAGADFQDCEETQDKNLHLQMHRQ